MTGERANHEAQQPQGEGWDDEEWEDPWVKDGEDEEEAHAAIVDEPYVGPSAHALRRQAMHTMGVVSSLGVQFVTVVGVSVWLGAKADAHYNSSPRLTILGLCVGLMCAIVIVWRLSRILKAPREAK